MFSSNFPASVANRAVALTIAADKPSTYGVAGYDIFAQASSPTDSVDVTVTINAGVKISQLRALGFAAGSRIFLVNNGFIYGAGGVGGTGGSIFNTGSYGAGAAGTSGTDALQSNCRLIITNISGQINGGGGGGIGGRCGSSAADGSANGCGGGGGGGGRGYPGGGGGGGGFGYTVSGGVGTAGTDVIVGTGVSGGVSGSYQGAWGGDGGTWATSGDAEKAPAVTFGPAGSNGANSGTVFTVVLTRKASSNGWSAPSQS